jgi:hypothetical protein
MVVLIRGASHCIRSALNKRVDLGPNIRLSQLTLGRRTIGFGRLNFYLPKWSDHFLASDISRGLIFFSRNETGIIFYKKVRFLNSYYHEEIGALQFDKDGYLLADGDRKPAAPNHKTDKPYRKISIAQNVEIFDVRERSINLNPARRECILGLFGKRISVSIDPNNVHYKYFITGKICFQVWRSGRVVFYKKSSNGVGPKIIGETSRSAIENYIEESGIAQPNLSSIVEELNVTEAPINLVGCKSGESPTFGFELWKIKFRFVADENNMHINTIINGCMVRRAYKDRVEIGINKRNGYKKLGEVKFNANDEIELDGAPFVYKGSTVKRKSPEIISYLPLKLLVPEVGAQRVDFDSKGEAPALSRIFALPVNQRYPVADEIKNAWLKVTSERVHLMGIGKQVNPYSFSVDSKGGMVGPNKVVIPAENVRVPIVKLVDRLDVENGAFTCYVPEGGTRLNIMARTRGFRFILTIDKNSPLRPFFELGKIGWRRSKDKFCLTVDGIPYAENFNINEKQMVISFDQGGKTRKIPSSKRLNVNEIFSVAVKFSEPLIKFVMAYDHEAIGIIFARSALTLLRSLLDNSNPEDVLLNGSSNVNNRVLYAYLVIMDRMRQSRDKLDFDQQLGIFSTSLLKYVESLFFMLISGNAELRYDAVAQQTIRISDYIAELEKEHGAEKVESYFKTYQSGHLYPYISLLYGDGEKTPDNALTDSWPRINK